MNLFVCFCVFGCLLCADAFKRAPSFKRLICTNSALSVEHYSSRVATTAKVIKPFRALHAALLVVTTFSLSTSFLPNALADGDGTKAEKKFELCLSKCLFDETRPPPVGAGTDRIENTRSRTEIMRGCKSQCAKTKEQLMLGKPKSPKAEGSE